MLIMSTRIFINLKMIYTSLTIATYIALLRS